MLKILLVDVDSKIPNLALMKISTHYRNIGYKVDLKRLNLTYYKKPIKKIIIDGSGYSHTFVSIIFRNNKDSIEVINCEDVQFGGVGYSLFNELSKEIDKEEPDYSIYPECDKSYGFITRGCIRNCQFCVVPKKEGMIHKYRTPEQIIKHKKVIFLDNNILAFKEHKEVLKFLVDKRIRCQFNQGLDIRLLTDENSKLLSQMNYIGEYIFAFDNLKDRQLIEDKLKLFKKYIIKDWKIKFYIYCHPDMDIGKDVLFRVLWCKKNKVLPYLMRDQSCWDSDYRDFYTDLSAYCNQPNLFKKISFEEFMLKRTKNTQRQKESINIFNTRSEVSLNSSQS